VQFSEDIQHVKRIHLHDVQLHGHGGGKMMKCIICDKEAFLQMKRKEMVVSLCYEHAGLEERLSSTFHHRNEMNGVAINKVD
jgi:hypothetical protein